MRKILISGIAMVGIAATLVFGFSVAETNFECSGHFSLPEGEKPVTLFAKLQEYRPWVYLWSDSDGTFFLEIPNIDYEHFATVKKIGEQRQIWDAKKLKGNLSRLSKVLALQTSQGFFDGKCKEI